MARAAARRRWRNEEFIDCAAAGRHKDVARLLEERADLEAVDRFGYTALSEAAMAGHTPVVGQLLRALADPNAQAQDGRTALHRAAFHGWIPVLNILLENGAEKNVKDSDGKLPADLCRTRQALETLTGFPVEKTQEAAAERRRKLAERPPPEPEPADEEEEEKPQEESSRSDEAAGDTAVAPAGAGVGGGGLSFQPPPRSGAKPDAAASKAEAKAAQDAKKAEKEFAYQRAIKELMADYGEDTAGAEAAALALQVPALTARAEVTGAGEERLNGMYMATFASQDRIEFEKEGDPQCQIFWSQWHDEWRMVIGDFKLGSVLYRHKYRPNRKVDECLGVPTEGWQKWFGSYPEPHLRRLEKADPDAEAPIDAEAAPAASEEAAPAAEGETPAAPAKAPALRRGNEFIELHPQLEIVAPAVTAAVAGKGAGLVQEVSLLGGERIVETADGLFGAGEVASGVAEGIEIVDSEAAAAAWLEGVGLGPEVPAAWDAIQAAKAAAQELYAEGRVTDARQATTAAIRAARRLLAERSGEVRLEGEPAAGAGSAASAEEVENLLGVLHSNRSLLLLQQIQAGDREVLDHGSEAAWRLVASDADIALRQDPRNFKASFRRARAYFELGDLDEALQDATRVVDHYARTSATPNPEAAALRERILEAARKERGKWGQKGPARWNRASQDSLITELAGGEGSAAIASEGRALGTGASGARGGKAKEDDSAQRLAALPSRPPPPPRNGGDVEKALLSTLKGDAARQLAYLREHLSPAQLRKFYRKAPLGPDLLAVLMSLLADLAEQDANAAGEVLSALAAAPSARTQTAMFDAKEQAALKRLLGRVAPAVAKPWEPEPEEEGEA
mmetsp:Transcript_87016/g.186449  ORF Transcript_87016/g.186449 Transcript_87016/m.186449 type:complete len:851 (+) Transcript_87016:51-2603(+)